MKRYILSIMALAMIAPAIIAQTLNVSVGDVTYQFPASQVGEMTYSDGSTLTILGKQFSLSDITGMSIDDTQVTDNNVAVKYTNATASIVVAGNIASQLECDVIGAHVAIAQSDDVDEEITYTLSGSTADGEFYLAGSYKATVVLNGVTLINKNPVNTGAAIEIQNGKRINIKVADGTSNSLIDAKDSTQKACLYAKGHIEFKQSGTLRIYALNKHGIKAGEYITLKNATINISAADGDGISCNEYFLQESGNVTIKSLGDDGIQCDIDGDASTGETTDHEDEDSGNIYIAGGTLTIECSATAAKGIKAEGDVIVSDGTINITTSGSGEWDNDDQETKAAACVSSDKNINVSGGTMTLTSTGSGGKAMKCDGLLTVSSGTITAKTTGGLYYNNGTTERSNYTGNTDNLSSSYYSSPKGIKAGVKTTSGNSTTYSGGIEITGGTINVTTSGKNAEGIESKNHLTISGGTTTVNAYDDAINSAQDLTITGGQVYARATNNDGIDANGNCYVKSGLIYVIGASQPEVAIDANSEDRKQLYVSGGTLVAIGGLESGSSLTQTCYSASSWNKNTWYALTCGNETFAFQTPSSGGNGLVVSAASTPSLKSGVTVASGSQIFDGAGYADATVSGGSSVSLSQYSGGNSGGGGSGPGGGGGGGRPGGGW